MRQLVLGRKICQVVGETNSNLITLLDKELSFQVPGAEYTRAFRGFIDDSGKMNNWDGQKHLLNGDLTFPPGLFERVKNFYDINKVQYKVVDNRGKIPVAKPIDLIPVLKERLGKEPYYYQNELIETAANNTLGIIKSATGSGKSISIALLVGRLNKTTIVYVIGCDLLYQMHELLSSLFDEEIGIIGDGKCEIKDINVATVWSVGQALGIGKKSKTEDDENERHLEPDKYRYIKQMLKATKVHIIDECQVCASDTLITIFKNIDPEHVYGFSASPYREDGNDLLIEGYLGHKIIDIPARKLITEGFLAEPIIKFLAVPPYDGPSTKAKYQTVYKNYITDNQTRNEMIIKGAIKLVEQGFKPLILFNNINHGKILHEMLEEKIPCSLLSGTDDIKRRNIVKENMEKGNIKCIVASRIFDAGLDLPFLSGLVLAGSGKSSIRALQRIGRVVRKFPGKKIAAIIDFADQAPFLRKHAEARYEIYKREGFNVTWPEEKKK